MEEAGGGGGNIAIRDERSERMKKKKKRAVRWAGAAEIAGVAVGEVIALLSDRVKRNLRKEDYLEGLANLERVW